jgi:adenine phosphoribosyltransferase
VSKTAVSPGNRILVIDDLIATGGTLAAALELLIGLGANVVECACIVELKCLAGGAKIREKYGVNVWALISEDVLQLEGQIL